MLGRSRELLGGNGVGWGRELGGVLASSEQRTELPLPWTWESLKVTVWNQTSAKDDSHVCRKGTKSIIEIPGDRLLASLKCKNLGWSQDSQGDSHVSVTIS